MIVKVFCVFPFSHLPSWTTSRGARQITAGHDRKIIRGSRVRTKDMGGGMIWGNERRTPHTGSVYPHLFSNTSTVPAKESFISNSSCCSFRVYFCLNRWTNFRHLKSWSLVKVYLLTPGSWKATSWTRMFLISTLLFIHSSHTHPSPKMRTF